MSGRVKCHLTHIVSAFRVLIPSLRDSDCIDFLIAVRVVSRLSLSQESFNQHLERMICFEWKSECNGVL